MSLVNKQIMCNFEIKTPYIEEIRSKYNWKYVAEQVFLKLVENKLTPLNCCVSSFN